MLSKPAIEGPEQQIEVKQFQAASQSQMALWFVGELEFEGQRNRRLLPSTSIQFQAFVWAGGFRPAICAVRDILVGVLHTDVLVGPACCAWISQWSKAFFGSLLVLKGSLARTGGAASGA